MENRNLNIDDLFRIELSGYTEVPPADVWEALGKRLDTDERKRRFGWWWFIAIALLVTGGIYFGHGFTNYHNESSGPHASARLTNNNGPYPGYATNTANTGKHIQKTNSYKKQIPTVNISNENTTADSLNKQYKKQKTMAYNGYKHIHKTILHTANELKVTEGSAKLKPRNNSQIPDHITSIDTASTQQNGTVDTNHNTIINHLPQISKNLNPSNEAVVKNNRKKQPGHEALATTQAINKHSSLIAKKMTATGAQSMTMSNANKENIKQNTSSNSNRKAVCTQGIKRSATVGTKSLNAVATNSNIAPLKMVQPNEPAPALPIKPAASAPALSAGKADSLVPNTKGSAKAPDTITNNSTKPNDSASVKKEKIRQIDLGFKAGIGRGTQYFSAINTVLSPYIQIHWSDKFSLLLQPGIKYNNITNNPFSSKPDWYDNIVHDSIRFAGTTINTNSSDPRYPKGNDTFDKYTFIRQYDSLAIKHSMVSSYWEFELPILLKYAIKPNLSVAAGPVFTFGSAVMINTSKITYNMATLTGIDSLLAGNKFTQSHMDSLIHTPHTPYSSYDSANYQNNISNTFHWGYMLQLSYTFRNKLLLDLSIQQNLSDNGFNANNYINKLYNQPYIRLSVGYKIATLHKKIKEKP